MIPTWRAKYNLPCERACAGEVRKSNCPWAFFAFSLGSRYLWADGLGVLRIPGRELWMSHTVFELPKLLKIHWQWLCLQQRSAKKCTPHRCSVHTVERGLVHGRVWLRAMALKGSKKEVWMLHTPPPMMDSLVKCGRTWLTTCLPLLAPSLMKVNPSLVFRRFLEILERLSHQGKLLKNSSSCAFSSMLISRELSFPGFQSGGRRRGWGEAHNQGIDLLLTHGLHTSTTWSPTWQTVCCSSSWNHRWELMENLLNA